MKALPSHFVVDLTLYPTEQGGRRQPIEREGFGCPCRLDPASDTFVDCRLMLNGQSISPGETKRVGIRFSYDPAAPLFYSAGGFLLWDGHAIGEAMVVSELGLRD